MDSPRVPRRSVRFYYLLALGGLLFALFLIVVVPSAWTYRYVRKEVDAELEERLLAIGTVVAETFGSLDLRAESTQDSAARLAPFAADLRRIAAASKLGQIQVMDRKRRHLAGTRDELTFGRRDPLIAVQPEVAIALAGIATATPIYGAPGVANTYFKTGFVPIEDDAGEVIGVVAVEGGSGFFAVLPALKRTWVAGGFASAVIAIVLIALLQWVYRAFDRYERGLRAAAALSTAGQLAAIVAHEVRNPLAILQTRAERIEEELKAGTDRAAIVRLLDAIPIEIARLDRILRNYLSLARVEESTGACAVASVLAETVELLQKDLGRASIEVVLDLPPRDVRAAISAGALRQVVLNLCLNARQAMSEGGRLEVRGAAEGDWVHVHVRDHGSGMDRGTVRRIFEPFYTTRSTGSGLGLAVVDSLVRSAGGRIAVQSAVGKGSTFTILLPRVAARSV